MIMVNIYEAKAKLSEYVEAATKGERIVICKHNQPVAELRPIEPAPAGPRDLTPLFPGATFTSAAFFEALPEDEIAAWDGAERDLPKVAEEREPYAPKSRRQRKPRGRR